MATTLRVNGAEMEIEADPTMPLLWVLRDVLGLKGTKFGCGIGACGACTIHLDGQATRSCSVTLQSASASDVVTIEGVSQRGELHPVQQAWIDEDVSQCGYCQAGQMMQAINLLEKDASPSDEDIVAAMNGNLCRCGSYARIFRAIRRAAEVCAND